MISSPYGVFTYLYIIFCCLSYIGSGQEQSTYIDKAFASFIVQYGRTYQKGSKEFEMRKDIFSSVMQHVENQNKRLGKSWKARVNKFADRTKDELSRLRGWKAGNRPGHSSAPRDFAKTVQFLTTSHGVPDLPKSHTWTNLTTVKEIQDQGGCGSCWAFASATVLRAHSEIWMGNPRKFSVQQIIACTPNPHECGGTGGCQGATAELAMDYVLKHGCRTESELPYTETDDNCPHKKDSLIEEGVSEEPSNSGLASASLGMLGWTKLPENKVTPLKAALVTKGPVAVSISAGWSWNQYDGGILDDCPRDAIIDHAVVLIGYGQSKALDAVDDDPEVKYWHLQNSWGTDWGERGLLRMLRFEDSEEENDQCGWDNDPQIGSGCNGGPPEVYVCGMCGLLYDTVIPHFSDKHKAGENHKHGSFLRQKQ
jgi:cathepsin L